MGRPTSGVARRPQTGPESTALSDPQAFALLVAALAGAPLLAFALARAGPRLAALVAAANLLGLVGVCLVSLHPARAAPHLVRGDLAVLHPTWGGVFALGVAGALAAVARPRERRALFVLVVAVGAYFVWDASWLVQEMDRTLERTTPKTDVCIQTTTWSCAPAAAVSLLRRLGIASTEAEMARLMHSRKLRGTNSLNAWRGLSRKLAGTGHRAELRELDYDGLVGARARGLAVFRLSPLLDHMVALDEATPVAVTVLDPLVGRRVVPRQEFEILWKREAILVVPAPGG